MEQEDRDAGPGLIGVLLVGLGGAVGTLVRHGLDHLIGEAAGWPMGILIVNVSGALLLGVLVEALALRGRDRGPRRLLRLLLGTGVLGGYTTYSLLVTDVAGLLLDGRAVLALAYGIGSIVLGALAAWGRDRSGSDDEASAMSDALTLLLMSLAGGVGAMLRHLVDTAVRLRVSTEFPVAIMSVNLSGSLALGILVGLLAEERIDLIIGTGVLGGYTTFSTASVDCVRLLQQRRWWAAVANGPGMLAAGTGLAVVGIVLGRLAVA